MKMESPTNPKRTPMNSPKNATASQTGWQRRRVQRSGSPLETQPRPSTRRSVNRRRSGVKTVSRQGIKAFWKKWLADGVAFTLLFGGSTLIAGSAWFSYQLIVNPDIGIWLNQFLPAWTQISLQRRDSIKTLDEIRASLKEEGLSMGEAFVLPTSEEILGTSNRSNGQETVNLSVLKPFLLPKEALVQAPSDLLIPILSKRESSVNHPCNSACEEIVQLQVYQAVQTPYQRPGSPQYFRLANQLEIEGPAESFVIASLISTQFSQQGSNKPLPLTNFSAFTGKVPSFGIWFNLNSERIIGDTKVPYGQIVHYNPVQHYLSVMLEWKSDAGQQPVWQDITGDKEPELLIEQTIGLEPQFSIYQPKPRKFVPNPIQLASISLDEIFVDDYDYRQALRLAKSGLWSAALELMKPLKQTLAKGTQSASKWPPAAEAQLDLIEFHAKITEAQAKAAWASPSQQVLASLIDGRWTDALNVLRTEPNRSQEIASILRADDGRLKNRIEAALEDHPEEADLQAWGALIVAAKQGRNEAIAWLNEQPIVTPQTKESIVKLLE